MGLLKETTFSLEEGTITEQRIDRSAEATDNSQLLFIFDPASQGHTNHRKEKGGAYTERLRSSLIALISIFRRPIVTTVWVPAEVVRERDTPS
jgi:hypothetical protein